MVRQMLYVQWRWNRDILAFWVLLCFAMPLMLFTLTMPEMDLMAAGRVIGYTILVLSLIAGGGVAAQGYGMDERVGHTYALSLPCPRGKFLGVRSLTAFALLLLPALGVWIGGMVTVSQVDIPPMLQAYPGWLAVKAVLAAWLAHSVVFGLRYSTGRRTKYVLVGLLMVLVIAFFFPASRGFLFRVGEAVTKHPGPLGIVFGRWSLIDV